MGILFQSYDLPLAVFSENTDNGPLFVQNLLQSDGLRTIITGDLRYSDAKQDPCVCPYHADGKCRCHEVILLVYGGGEPPITLILQCRGPWTCIYMSSASVTKDNRITKQKLIGLLVPKEEQENCRK